MQFILSGLRYRLTANAMALMVTCALLTVSLLATWRVVQLDRNVKQQRYERITGEISGEIEAYYKSRYAAASLLRTSIAMMRDIPPERLTAMTDALRAQYPEIIGANFIDADRIITFVNPVQTNASALGRKVGQSPEIIALLDRAERENADVATPPVELFQGGQGIVFYLPLRRNDVHVGMLNIVLRSPTFHPGSIDVDSWVAVTSTDEDKIIFKVNTLSPSAEPVTRDFHVLNRTLKISVGDSDRVPMLSSHAGPIIVLVCGILVSCSIGYLTYQLQRRRRRAVATSDQLKRFNEMSSDWLWEQDEQFRFTFVSDSNAKITGMPAAAHYGRTRRQTKPLDVSDADFAAHEKQLKDLLPFYDFRFSRINPDGRKKFLTISGEPTFSRRGRFLGYRGIGRDLTTQTILQQIGLQENLVYQRLNENRRLDEILRNLLNWLEGLNISSKASMLMYDASTRTLTRGISPSLPAAYMKAIDGIEARPGNGSCGHAAATGQTVIIDNTAEHPFWSEYRDLVTTFKVASCWSAPVMSPSGTLLGALALYHDLPTEPIAFEIHVLEQLARIVALAIERSRERDQIGLINLAFSKVDEGLIITDYAGTIVAVNPATCMMNGYSADELIGKNVQFLHAADEQFEAMRQAILKSGHWQGEMTNTRRDGSVFVVRQSINALRSLDGRIINFVGISFDVTNQKRFEKEIIEARIAADTANRSKSMFLANMSHELRTPLNAIIGLAEVIGTEALGPIGNEKYREYLSDILQSGRHLLSLINDILDLTKIVEYGAKINRERLLVSDVVESAMPTVRRLAQDKNVILDIAVEPDNLEFMVDGRAIRQILINVIGNAVKFTPAGGKISLQCRRDTADTGTILTVRDTGPGIPEPDIQHVGQPFLQVKDVYTSGSTGTGLGLAITKSLVAGHKGQFTIRNRPEGGLEVVIELPDMGEETVAPDLARGRAYAQ